MVDLLLTILLLRQGSLMQKVFFAFAYEYDNALPWYRVCLKNTVKDAGFYAVFANEEARAGHILDHISDCIDQSALGFYDITGLNPNVLIEFGIGHASGKPCFLLLNKELHQRETQTLWGKRATPMPIPADLEGVLRYEYTSSHDLGTMVRRAIEQNLKQPKAGMALANEIIQRLKAKGPANMSTIAKDIKRPLEDVRPILKSLVATDQVTRQGHSRGTTYTVQ
ncbi:MAG TPA: hypothetical protein VG943_12855 [Caulobacterales bacterium]|nr:hypothetical protein [Caulobacterales bacterium]